MLGNWYIGTPDESLEDTQAFYKEFPILRNNNYDNILEIYEYLYSDSINDELVRIYDEHWNLILTSTFSCTPYLWIIRNSND
jgi:hypothetical protein